MNPDAAGPLERVAQLFAVDNDAERVAAVDQARAEGATWQDIAHAMGHADRRAAQTWRARRP